MQESTLQAFTLQAEHSKVKTFEQLAAEFNKPVDVELHFGRGEKGTFFGEKRPPVEAKTIREHGFLDGHLIFVTGRFFNLLYQPSYQRLEIIDYAFQEHDKNRNGTSKPIGQIIKDTLLKYPTQPGYSNGYSKKFCSQYNEFVDELKHEDTAFLANLGNVPTQERINFIDVMLYQSIPPELLKGMTYSKENIFYVCSQDKSGGYFQEPATSTRRPQTLKLLTRF